MLDGLHVTPPRCDCHDSTDCPHESTARGDSEEMKELARGVSAYARVPWNGEEPAGPWIVGKAREMRELIKSLEGALSARSRGAGW